MYISKIYLDKRNRKTAEAIYNRHIIHGALEGCFKHNDPEKYFNGPDRKSPLWCLDNQGGILTLLVVSNNKPDFTSFEKQFGKQINPQTKPYDDFLENKIEEGDILRFHMTANPTIKKNNKRIPLNMNKTANHSYCAYDWIADRLQNNGAQVIDVKVSNYMENKIRKPEKKRTITLISADFDGFIKVTDKEKLLHALKNGIGHGKAYGCGMLMVAK